MSFRAAAGTYLVSTDIDGKTDLRCIKFGNGDFKCYDRMKLHLNGLVFG